MKTPGIQASPHARGVTPPGLQANHPLGDRIVSLPEASTISGLSVDTLRRCHDREELRIIKLSPRRVGIRLSELWAFIEARAA